MTERDSARLPVARYTHFDSAFGGVLLASARGRLLALRLGVPKRRLHAALNDLHDAFNGAYALRPGGIALASTARQIAAYLEGRRGSIDAECDLERFSAFQRRVLETTRRIPRGEVASYAEVARGAGYPGAHRAVGNTMRINPVPIVIPCHRVVGSNGIGGYGALGVATKRRLLALEGAAIAG